jgi:hypothetical protein
MNCSLVMNNQDDTAEYSSVQTKALFDFANILCASKSPISHWPAKSGLIHNALSGEKRMRRILISALTPLILAIPASAQNLPPNQNAAPDAAQNQNAAESPQTIQESLRSDLGRAGFTDIQLVPSSFLVRAKDPDGNPVTLVLTPEAFTAVEVAPGQGSVGDEGGRNSPPWGQPSTSGAGATDSR